MPNLVCTGASLQCSFGTTPATFSASSSDVSAGQVAAGTVADIGAANIASFGMCTSMSNPTVASASSASGVLTPQPCQPVLSLWSPGSTGVTIDGNSALDDSSTCPCTWGGTVTVGSAGQVSATVT